MQMKILSHSVNKSQKASVWKHLASADYRLNGNIYELIIRGVTMKFPEWFYYMTLRKLCSLIVVKTCLCMFQLAPIMISTN